MANTPPASGQIANYPAMNTQPSLYNQPAPAKLNLFLHILGQRNDGYHLLQSVFMLIDWQDSLDFTRTTNGCISRSDEGCTALPANDLCTRAARLLQQNSDCHYGAHIHLRKNIPTQAGMGGGSSDAATTLLALNRLWDLHYTPQQLAALGLQLGADVPFFISGHNAWVEGIGERLQPIDLPAARWIIVKPDAGVSTPEIFSAPDLFRATPAATMRDFVAANDPLNFGHNDLQTVATRLCPPIAQALEWLAKHGLKGRMTGSGSAVFARLADGEEIDAEKMQQSAPKNWIIRVCNNLSSHPLL